MALTLYRRRWYPFIFLVGLAILVALWVHRPELLLSAVVVFAGFIYFLYKQHLDETKLFKDLFTEFNKRYDELHNVLNAIRLAPVSNALTISEEEFLFTYFNLCAEEYFFYTSGYIDQLVWESWNRGMKVFFQNQRIRALWDQDCKGDSYYRFQPPE